MADVKIQVILDTTEAGTQAKVVGEVIDEVKTKAETPIKPHIDTVPAQRSLDQVAMKSGNARMAVLSFSQGLQDSAMFSQSFRMGMMGISNNVDMVVQSLVLLKEESKRTGVSMFQSLRSVMTGPTGILIGLSAVITALQILPVLFKKTGDAAEEASKKGLQDFADWLDKFSREQLDKMKANAKATIDVLNEQINKIAPKGYVSVPGATGQKLVTIESTLGPADQARLKNLRDQVKAQQDLITNIDDAVTREQAHAKETEKEKALVGEVGNEYQKLKFQLDELNGKKKRGVLVDTDGVKIADKIEATETRMRTLAESTADAKKRAAEEAKKQADETKRAAQHEKDLVDATKAVNEANAKVRIAAIQAGVTTHAMTPEQELALLQSGLPYAQGQDRIWILKRMAALNQGPRVSQKQIAYDLQPVPATRNIGQTIATESLDKDKRYMADMISQAEQLGAIMGDAFSGSNSEAQKMVAFLRMAVQLAAQIAALGNLKPGESSMGPLTGLLGAFLGMAGLMTTADEGAVVTGPSLVRVGPGVVEAFTPLNRPSTVPRFLPSDNPALIQRLDRLEAAIRSMPPPVVVGTTDINKYRVFKNNYDRIEAGRQS